MWGRRGVHRMWGCRRDGSACPPARACFLPYAPVRRDGLGVQGCPVVVEHRCRGAVEPACPPAPALVLAWLGPQAWRHRPVALAHRDAERLLQAVSVLRLEPRSVVSDPSRGLGDWVRQLAAASVWPPSDAVELVLPLRDELAEPLVLRPELACLPARACSPVALRPPLVSLVLGGVEAWRRSVAPERQLETAWSLVWLQLAWQEAVLPLQRAVREVPTPRLLLPLVWPQPVCLRSV